MPSIAYGQECGQQCMGGADNEHLGHLFEPCGFLLSSNLQALSGFVAWVP
jgi:hypothetical protein